ncbi:MAG: peptidoglycan editing factor PgeF [Deltaproteobacteria bacterium]|nr:peptidoglycan editing factor PgeF [Deltaproteobacteria bacterium]
MNTPGKENQARAGGEWLPVIKADPPCYLFANMAAATGIRHGIFTRIGGGSAAPFQSLNVSLGVGDRQDSVNGNRNRIASCLGVEQLIFSDQVHGDDILIFKNQNRHAWSGTSYKKRAGDAMITDSPGIGLAIQIADCQAVVLYDPEQAVVANIHAGWRGSIVNIIGKTVKAMTLEFGCDPANMLAGVGPSLGPCCAEFVNYREEIPEIFWPYKVSQDHFDFWSISRDQLANAGVPDENIRIVGICTRCHPDLFFSYRAERITGRFVVVAGLVQEGSGIKNGGSSSG